MAKFAVLWVLVATMLAGCGEVIVFGHVVGERKTAEQPQPDRTPSSAATPATAATSATAAGAPSTSAGSGAPAPQPGSPAAPGTSSAETRLAAAASSAPHVVKSVNIVVTPEAAAKVTGDASRFTADALLDAIKTELKSRKLLDEQNPRATGTAEIVVDDLATRPTSNVILFGYKMLAGTLEGDIRVTGATDNDSTGSRIVAQSKLTLAASGDDKNPLGPLYRRFAVLAADRLAGVESQPQDPSGIPRF
jgi:hypothetical protein